MFKDFNKSVFIATRKGDLTRKKHLHYNEKMRGSIWTRVLRFWSRLSH